MQQARYATPAGGEAAADTAFLFEQVSSPIGTMLLVTDAQGRVRMLDFSDYEARMRELMRRQYKSCEVKPGAAPLKVRAAVAAYFDGDLLAIDRIEVATGGTDFQRKVWKALRDIRPGRTESYGGLAKRLGMDKAVRAVGLANGANPIGVIVPCHRVIGSDGTLTGYGGGLPRKRWLLKHEGAAFREGKGKAVEPEAMERLPGM